MALKTGCKGCQGVKPGLEITVLWSSLHLFNLFNLKKRCKRYKRLPKTAMVGIKVRRKSKSCTVKDDPARAPKSSISAPCGRCETPTPRLPIGSKLASCCSPFRIETPCQQHT